MQEMENFPILLTDNAIKQMIAVRDGDPDLGENFAVRVSCKGGGCSGIIFNLDFDNEFDDEDYQKKFSLDSKEILVVVDYTSAPYLEGLTVDFVKQGLTEGFKFEGGSKVKKTCGCGKSFSV